MKSAILFIFGVIIAAGIGAGAVYILKPVSDNIDYAGKIAANESALADMRNVIEKNNSDMASKLDSINETTLALSARLENVERQVKEAQKRGSRVSEMPSMPETDSADAPPSDVEELVKKVIEERDKERQKERDEQRAERMAGMQKMMGDMVTNQINEFAKKKNWNISKQQEVSGIIDGSMKKIGELFKGFRMDGPPSGNTFEKMREIMEETEAKLKEVMTEEEWKEFQESMPGPGMFGPGMRPRGGSEGPQPGQ